MDTSKLPDTQYHHQQQDYATAATAVQPPPPYAQSYNYNCSYNDPSLQQQSLQYDASSYHNYYSNLYHHQQQPNVGSGSGSLGLGFVQDPNIDSVNAGYLGINPAMMHYGQGHFQSPGGHSPYRGGGRGNTSSRPPNTSRSGPTFRGRGRGRGSGRGGRRAPPFVASSSHPESSAQANAQQPPRIAWCELCRVDCTSMEILQQHNNGKKHQKNLQKLEAMKTVYQPVVDKVIEEKPSSDIGKNEPDKQAILGAIDNKPETDKNENQNQNQNQETKPRMKRKMKGGARGGARGAKRLKPKAPRKPKIVIPLMCDLCNVKCDTQEVFNRHVGGKKHMAKLKRFEGHQAMYGPTAVQALYPPNPLLQTLVHQPVYDGAPSSYHAPPEAYIPPHGSQNPNQQLADAPLEFVTRNVAPEPQTEQVSTTVQ
ncbi:uncharacterized protein [Rutidosis leptorrhynchoides]|uniref:uncharacterized protein n=1 Tax=Rutidosis leptorrhynchoides TaxID=125765 RepID=UPI003A9A1A63